MDLFGRDALIGDYRLSDHGLLLVTFNYESDYDLGISHDTEETFLGKNPVPTYLGSKHSAKLMPTFTVMKNEQMTGSVYFETNELREILGRLTGYQGYKKVRLYKDSFLEDIYYNVHVKSASFVKTNDRVIGITFEAECDSQFGWVDDNQSFTINGNNQIIKLKVNSDEKYVYLLPKLTISASTYIDKLTITNVTDNNRKTEIDSISANEIITMDSKRNIISSSISSRNFSRDFNYKFLQLVDGENELTVSNPCSIEFNLMLPRKVGVF